MKIKNNMEDKDRQKLRKRLEEVLESESGFIILADDNGKLTDFYQGICPQCIIKAVADAVIDYDKLFGLPTDCEKHQN